MTGDDYREYGWDRGDTDPAGTPLEWWYGSDVPACAFCGAPANGTDHSDRPICGDCWDRGADGFRAGGEA